MKKLFALVLVLCLALSAVSFAGAEELALKYLDSSLYPVAEGAALDIWCGQDGNVVDYTVNPENAALEKLTGVKINWITAPGTQADMNVAFNLNLASGKGKKVAPLMYVLAVLFVLKYIFL